MHDIWPISSSGKFRCKARDGKLWLHPDDPGEPARDGYHWGVSDDLGDRTLRVSDEKEPCTREDIQRVRDIERLTGTRLRDDECPSWFLAHYDRYCAHAAKHPVVSFAEFCRQTANGRVTILAATPSVASRTFPSDYLPASIDEFAADELIPEAIKQATRIRKDTNDSFDGPCNRALLDYLKWYVGTPHERDVWNRYYDWGRPHKDKLPLIERAAKKAGLSTWEYIADKTLQELRRFVQANEIPAPVPEAPPTVASIDRSGQGAGDGWTWQVVRDELERLRLQGERYTSREKLGDKIGCRKFLVVKAIKHGSTELQEWASKKAKGQSRLDLAPEVSALVFDQTPQRREPDPANLLEDEDIDAAMGLLIDQATPGERAKIHAMTPADRRQLAETLYRDPDREEQAQRYRKANRNQTH